MTLLRGGARLLRLLLLLRLLQLLLRLLLRALRSAATRTLWDRWYVVCQGKGKCWFGCHGVCHCW